MIDPVEKTTIRKIYVRLLPLLFVAYFICYLDRINVGFAALTMNTDLGFTATVYALGATAFFWGYCLFEVPSNIILEKLGARIWIARIMISWGIGPEALRPPELPGSTRLAISVVSLARPSSAGPST